MTETTYKGIETEYRGTTFRSRLEARWAAMFDILGMPWIYEPFDTRGYIPDFLIQGVRPLLIEVKPAVTRDDYQVATPKIECGLSWPRYDTLILGASPLAPSESQWAQGMPVAGLMASPDTSEDPTAWWWDDAVWTTCWECGANGVCSTIHSYRNRPCSHYDGNSQDTELPLAALWGEAHKATRWARRR